MRPGFIIFFLLSLLVALSWLVYSICIGQTLPIVLSSIMVFCVLGELFFLFKDHHDKNTGEESQ